MAQSCHIRLTSPFIVAVAILLLPILYIVSYLALVVPPTAALATRPRGPKFWQFNQPGFAPARRIPVADTRGVASVALINQDFGGEDTYYYRWGGKHAPRFFWPLEQFDRRVRVALPP